MTDDEKHKEQNDDVSVAYDPDEPAGVVDLSSDGSDSPEDVYKQILDMREGDESDKPVEGGGNGAPADDQDETVGADTEHPGGGGGDAFNALNEKYLRALADLDNLRKRQQRNQLEMRKFGGEAAIREMLPVLDNLERAIAAVPDDPEGELAKFLEGTQMIVQQFLSALGRLGVERLDAEGQRFDPELHEAVQEFSSPEHEPGICLHQMEPGYKLYDRLLRPAKVVVTKAASGQAASDSESS